MNIFKRFGKSSSLRVVNLLGLSIVFASILMSYSFIRKELSYDRHNKNADRIVRMSIQYNDKPADVRLNDKLYIEVLQPISEIEKTEQLFRINTGILTYQGEAQIINNIYFASPDFFDVFTVPLIQGEKEKVLRTSDQVVISESLSRQLFGDPAKALGKEFALSGWKIGDRTVFVSGVFKDIPETSHFHSDLLLHLPETYDVYYYNYLLLHDKTNLHDLQQKISQIVKAKTKQGMAFKVILTPLTDIHLHSHLLREIEQNGNINYIYLVVGANLLLLLVVLFNLWLNSSLIFSYNRRYYQLLRLHGASSYIVVKDESLLALILGLISLLVGILMSYYTASSGYFSLQIKFYEIVVLSLIFMSLIVFVSLLPVLKNISSTLFLNTNDDLKPVRFSYSNIRYMLTMQYAVVMIVVILAFGIGKQMNMIKNIQVGGNDSNILVVKEQTGKTKEKYALLKSELLKHTEVESVTACFQLPGEAILDVITVWRDDRGKDDKKVIPLCLVGEDFFPFFGIQPVAGRIFSPEKLDYQQEVKLLNDRFDGKFSGLTEEYVINRKAMTVLGFNSPEEAIGKTLQTEHSLVDYINKGVICGVTDDFNYTGVHEASVPMIIMQRQLLLHCIMIRLNPDSFQESVGVFNKAWNEINPDCPADYTFMDDVYGSLYHNELNAERLVYVFSLLCLVIADLGLIIFMAFIIKRRTKEIGIRKVNGAGAGEIIRMLNLDFIRWIALAFVIAVPVAWYVMYRWLENFAYRTSLDWWIFVLSGLAVLLISVISVSLQSWRAATTNPVEAIKTE